MKESFNQFNTISKGFVLIIYPILAFVIFMGIYSTISMFQINKKIEKEGIETIGTITEKWRDRCGSGSGNSSKFIVNIRGFDLKLKSDCGVPDEVEIGDKYMVKYLINDPTKNIIYYNRKVK